MTTKLEKDKENFITWLKQEKKIGNKVARDYYYRCQRIETNIVGDIYKHLSDKEKYSNLIRKIHDYSVRNTDTKKRAYVLVATFRSAIKKYGEYNYPKMKKIYDNRVICSYEKMQK